jgi:hypothetical protein
MIAKSFQELPEDLECVASSATSTGPGSSMEDDDVQSTEQSYAEAIAADQERADYRWVTGTPEFSNICYFCIMRHAALLPLSSGIISIWPASLSL